MDSEIETASSEHTIWKRGLYMLLFLFLLWIAKFVTYAVIVLQFLSTVITGATNQHLLVLGQSLSTYTYQIIRYLTFNSEYHPYPMGDWPEGEPAAIEKAKE